MSPFRFDLGQRVRVCPEYLLRTPAIAARINTNLHGEITALTVDKQGAYASVRFPDDRLLLAEEVLIGV